MGTISQKQINDAAKAHAKDVLGDQQFKSNSDAVKSISEDFKSGVKWLSKAQKQK